MKDLQKRKKQQLHVATTGNETVSSEIGLYQSQPYRSLGRPLGWMQRNSSDSYFQGAIKANKFVPIKTSTGSIRLSCHMPKVSIYQKKRLTIPIVAKDTNFIKFRTSSIPIT